MITSKRSQLGSCPTHLLLRYNPSSNELAGAPEEVERSAVPRNEFPVKSFFFVLVDYGSKLNVADFPLQLVL